MRSLDAIVWAVNPRNDTLDSLLQYLSHYAYEFFQDTSVECQLDIPTDLQSVPLSAEVRHNLFLAVKEALNNVLKHARASRVRLGVALKAGELTVQIEDNGSGMDPDATGRDTRSGLGNMRQRLESIGGTLEIRSQPGQGTTVALHLHLHAGDGSAPVRQDDRDGTGA